MSCEQVSAGHNCCSSCQLSLIQQQHCQALQANLIASLTLSSRQLNKQLQQQFGKGHAPCERTYTNKMKPKCGQPLDWTFPQPNAQPTLCQHSQIYRGKYVLPWEELMHRSAFGNTCHSNGSVGVCLSSDTVLLLWQYCQHIQLAQHIASSGNNPANSHTAISRDLQKSAVYAA